MLMTDVECVPVSGRFHGVELADKTPKLRPVSYTCSSTSAKFRGWHTGFGPVNLGSARKPANVAVSCKVLLPQPPFAVCPRKAYSAFIVSACQHKKFCTVLWKAGLT